MQDLISRLLELTSADDHGKKKGPATSKASAKAAKKAKAAEKVERKEKKKTSKAKDESDDEDLEGILEKMQKEWEEAHTVTEELSKDPLAAGRMRRLLHVPTAITSGVSVESYLAMMVEQYSPEKVLPSYQARLQSADSWIEQDEWRKFVSPTCPGPRSAHAVVASPAGGGKLFLFGETSSPTHCKRSLTGVTLQGGEFSSLHQNTFHHYRDFWCFDITTHSWDRIDTKIRPSARSGHRYAHPVCKYTPTNNVTGWLYGNTTFSSLVVSMILGLRVCTTVGGLPPFLKSTVTSCSTIPKRPLGVRYAGVQMAAGRIQGHRIQAIVCRATNISLLLYSRGYCKEYAKGKRPVGVMLDDTWFLNRHRKPDHHLNLHPLIAKWERRKRPSTAYAPALRSGCTMTLWTAKMTGVLFGGVTDEDTSEETLESHFWNDLNGYQLTGKGRWMSMTLRRPKAKGGAKKRKPQAPSTQRGEDSDAEAL
ncbi:galactose oxidase [Salix suchowensis]|nr:galactose oxidase [Salix suchowensis]